MMDLNFNELIGPYSANGRTLKGQIRWLRKKSISPNAIEAAIQYVYAGLHTGELKYESGHELDRALFDKAVELQSEEDEIILQRLERVNIPGGRFKKAWAALMGKI